MVLSLLDVTCYMCCTLFVSAGACWSVKNSELPVKELRCRHEQGTHVKNAITREMAKGTIKNISNNGWKSTFEVNNVVNVNVIGNHNVVNVTAQPKKR